MPLTPDEYQQAKDLARGMLMAQRENLSLAGNIISNPHFTNIPHEVKLEAMREYSRLDSEDPAGRDVNIVPDKKEMAKKIARSAAIEGAVSLPISAMMAVVGAPQAIGVAYNAPKRSLLRTAKRSLPMAGGLFLANALVGGIKEGINQKQLLEEARLANKYLEKIRSTSSDEDVNAMLMASTPVREGAIIRRDKARTAVETGAKYTPLIGPRLPSEMNLQDPSSSHAAQWLNMEGLDMIQDIKKHGVREGWSEKRRNMGTKIKRSEMGKQAELNTKPFKTPKKSWSTDSSPLRHTKTSKIQKAKSAKIRREAAKEYEAAIDQGISDYKLYAVAKKSAKTLLRI